MTKRNIPKQTPLHWSQNLIKLTKSIVIEKYESNKDKQLTGLGNFPGLFVFRPGWPFLSRFPGFSVPGGITYRFCLESPLNRISVEIKDLPLVVRAQ